MCMSVSMTKLRVSVYECEWSEYQSVGLSVREWSECEWSECDCEFEWSGCI